MWVRAQEGDDRAPGDCLDPRDQIVSHHLLERLARGEHQLTVIVLDERDLALGQCPARRRSPCRR